MGDAADYLDEQEFNLHNLPETHRRRPEFTWTTRDGQKIPVSKMKTSHIQNCIRMLERNVASRPDEYAWGEPEGDAAQDAFNSEVRHNDMLEEKYRHAISKLQEELTKRNDLLVNRPALDTLRPSDAPNQSP